MIHPCFDGHEHSHSIGRIHVPLVARCNIKCSYCSRKASCIHESRPGLSEKVLSVAESLDLIKSLKNTNLKIIGIAGPGDPFAEPEKLFSFIWEIRETFGDYYELCISTNGMVLYNYIDLLKKYQVNYITLTINTINPDILSELVDWVNDDGVIYKGKEAAERLLAGQIKSLEAVVDAGIRCKVNTVIVPDINQFEIPNLLREIKSIGVEKGNLIPLIPVKGTKFEKTHTISGKEYDVILNSAMSILNQVIGCKKCRADAAYIRVLSLDTNSSCIK